MSWRTLRYISSLIVIAFSACQMATVENPGSEPTLVTSQAVTIPPRSVTIPPRGIIDLNPNELENAANITREAIRPQFVRDIASNLLIDIESGRVLDEESGELKDPSQLTIPPRNLTIPPRSILNSDLTIPPRGFQKSLLRVALIDAPADFKSVFVELDKATLMSSQQQELEIALADNITQPIDLLTLREKALKLNDLSIEPSTQYTQLCLYVKKASLVQENEETHDLSFTNGKTCVDVAFTSKDQTMDLLILDFDALKSIQGSKEQGFQLSPALSATVLEVPAVDDKDIQSLSIEPQFVTITLGSTIQLTAIGKNSQGHSFRVNANWTVSDNSVGTVDLQGNFKALSEGQAVVTASFNNQSAQVQLTVIPEPIIN